jgi:hypothetical protein
MLVTYTGEPGILDIDAMALAVSIDSNKEFEPVLEMIQPAVLADIVDKGQVPNKFKPGSTQHKCYFVWLVQEEDENGRNKRVFESFTVSLNEKATLRKRLKELGYKDFEPGVPFDLETLIGTQRTLVLAAEDGTDGRTFIKVTATMAMKKGQVAVEIPKDFVRKQDQE